MASPQQSSPPLAFRIVFLYLEPLLAVNGGILALLYPTSLLSGILPPNTFMSLTPIHNFLLIHLGSLWLFLGIIEAVVLRLTSDLNVWSAVLGAMLVSDIGLLYAPQTISPGWDIYWRADLWTKEDWMNIGLSNVLLAMRIAFLMWAWVWRNESGAKGEKKHAE